jgi:hypothetical protein
MINTPDLTRHSIMATFHDVLSRYSPRVDILERGKWWENSHLHQVGIGPGAL